MFFLFGFSVWVVFLVVASSLVIFRMCLSMTCWEEVVVIVWCAVLDTSVHLCRAVVVFTKGDLRAKKDITHGHFKVVIQS